MSVVVAGWLRVRPGTRDAYLASCSDVVRAARATPRCLDFSLGADLVDADRVNVHEHWSDVEALHAFRGSGPSDDQQDAIVEADVRELEVVPRTRP